jgi:hypothetical protein
MIARRLACRIWSACLHGRAEHLRRLATIGAIHQAARRHGPAEAEDARRKVHGRRTIADELDAVARAVEHWGGDDRRCQGPDIAPDVVAWVCCYICGETEQSLPTLRRAGAVAPGDPVGGPYDVKRAIERLLD